MALSIFSDHFEQFQVEQSYGPYADPIDAADSLDGRRRAYQSVRDTGQPGTPIVGSKHSVPAEGGLLRGRPKVSDDRHSGSRPAMWAPNNTQSAKFWGTVLKIAGSCT